MSCGYLFGKHSFANAKIAFGTYALIKEVSLINNTPASVCGDFLNKC